MRAWITQHPIEPRAVLEGVGSPADGAAVLFLGTVRAENEGRAVRGMRYEAYVDMAEDVLAEITREAAARARSDHVVVVHRVGELAVGDVSVAIAVSTPHRAPAFEAARYVIEEIKKRLPVWKHEHYESGEAEWVRSSAEAAG